MKQKLSIYIKFIHKTDNFKWSVCPKGAITTVNSDQVEITSEIDSNEFTFSVSVDQCEQGQALVIEKISVNDLELTTALDRIGTYITSSNKRKTTYGYMDEPGTYQFKIKNNAMYTHFMSYLLGEVVK